MATPALLLVAAGCHDRLEQVRSYAVPKEQPPVAAPVAAPSAPATPAAPLAWTLPDGWQQVPNPNTMRFATLQAGEGEQAMEISITRLSGTAGGVAANVNRWRSQIGLPPADDAELARIVRPIEAAVRGVLIDLVAPDAEETTPRMLAAIVPARTDTWFVKAVGPHAVLETHVAGFETLCGSMHFASSPATETGMPQWSTLPDGWTLDDPPRPMAAASMTVIADGGEAAVTITRLGGEQDVLANVNRWRRQLGVGPAARLEEAGVESFEVAGTTGHIVDIVGDENRTLGVITSRGPDTWFFKLTGPDPLVGEQRPAFETFVRSVRFE